MWLPFLFQFLGDPYIPQHDETFRFHLYSEGMVSFYSVRESDSKNLARIETAKRLTNLLIGKAIPKIPGHLLDKIKSTKLAFIFDPDCKGDAVFLGELDEKEQTENNILEICMYDGPMSEQALHHLVVHEFFHALHFIVHPDEPTWLREGLAVWFEEWVLDEINFGAVEMAMTQSETQFFGDYLVGKTSMEQYGHNYLFFRFLSEKCDEKHSEASLLWRIVESQSDHFGGATLRIALEKHRDLHLLKASWCENWVDVLLFYEIARVHNRIIYEPSRSSVFKLIQTTRQMKKTPIQWNDFKPKEWSRFRPMVLPLGAFPKEKAPDFESGAWKRVYLHEIYPYEVEWKLPNTDIRPKEWSEMWIKM